MERRYLCSRESEQRRDESCWEAFEVLARSHTDIRMGTTESKSSHRARSKKHHQHRNERSGLPRCHHRNQESPMIVVGNPTLPRGKNATIGRLKIFVQVDNRFRFVLISSIDQFIPDESNFERVSIELSISYATISLRGSNQSCRRRPTSTHIRVSEREWLAWRWILFHTRRSLQGFNEDTYDHPKGDYDYHKHMQRVDEENRPVLERLCPDKMYVSTNDLRICDAQRLPPPLRCKVTEGFFRLVPPPQSSSKKTSMNGLLWE